MNKSLIIGLVGGIAVATAGGVAGYALMSQSGGVADSGSAVVGEAANIPAESPAAADHAAAMHAAETAAVPASQPAPAPAPRPAATPAPAPRPQPAAAAPAPTVAAEPVVEQRCWDEEVTVQADPRDDKAIAGTATGAILGGAIAKRLGDDNDLATAAGAAAGAFAGRRIQRNIQENNTTTVVERRCEPVLQ